MENKGKVIKSVSTNHRKNKEVTQSAEILDLPVSKNTMRDLNTSFNTRKGSIRMHKAKFSMQYNQGPSFEYQYLSIGQNNKVKSVMPSVFHKPMKSIDISFDNLRVGKNGKIDRSSLPRHLKSLNSRLILNKLK